jgi:hypothetical protein
VSNLHKFDLRIIKIIFLFYRKSVEAESNIPLRFLSDEYLNDDKQGLTDREKTLK